MTSLSKASLSYFSSLYCIIWDVKNHLKNIIQPLISSHLSKTVYFAKLCVYVLYKHKDLRTTLNSAIFNTFIREKKKRN